jgi:putative ABC transport system permease protein
LINGGLILEGLLISLLPITKIQNRPKLYNNINKERTGVLAELKLQPVADIHYNSLYAEGNISYTINYRYLYLLATIALFLILAACINYTNLSTSLAVRKSKEVGVRKTMGAKRSQLAKQFFSETFLLTGLVIIAAAGSVGFLLPVVNDFLDKNIPAGWVTGQSVVLLLALWVVISIVAGIYPAFVLSGFNPITALKNKFAAPKTSALVLRRGLVVFQFLTAQILIIGVIVVAKQMNFIQSKPLGFQKDKVVDIGLPGNKPEQLSALKNKLSAVPGISSVSFSLGAPVSDNNFNTGFNRKEKYAAEKIDVSIKVADKEYLQTYGLNLLAGRWFDESDEKKVDRSIPDSLRQYSVVLNETAVKALGFSNPQQAIGKHIQMGLNDIVVPVIGVMKDYHLESLHANVLPVAMLEFPFFYYNAGIKLTDGYSANTIAGIEKAWSSVYKDNLFEANFLDEHIASLYKNEKRMLQLFNFFALLSIIINALGLIGLLSFMIRQKTKEIGIRKVMGASVANISFILSKDFLQLIAIAFVIAMPAAWFLMNRWLQDFAYRTNISWWVFALAITVALLVTLIAVGFQTIKAAVANPVKSLRTE